LYKGFTLGFNYADLGRYGVYPDQNRAQHVLGAGLKYEFSKYAVGFNWLGGEGYDNMLNLASDHATAYVKDFNNYMLGGTYAWAPGLTTNVSAVLFSQTLDKTGAKDNDGYVLLISQKLAF